MLDKLDRLSLNKCPLHLLDVKEVFSIKGNGSASDRNVLIQGTTVADVCPHGKGHSFGLRQI